MLLKTDPIRKITLSSWIKILIHSEILSQKFWSFAIVNNLKNFIAMPCSSFEWILWRISHIISYDSYDMSHTSHMSHMIWPEKVRNLPSCQRFPPIFPTSVVSTVHKKQRLRNVPLSQFFDKGCIKPFDRILSRSFRMLKIYFVCIIQNITVNDSQKYS